MTDDLNRTIGENLRQLRVEAGLSQAELGQFLGVTFQQIQKYEIGSNRLSAARVWQLCGFFEVEYPRFFEAARSSSPLSQTLEDLRPLIKAIRRAKPEIRQALCTLLAVRQ